MSLDVIPYSVDDLPALGLFFKKHYPAPGEYGTMGHFQWKILENPVMPGLINLVKDGNRIVSATSVTPKKLYLGGVPRTAAEIGDTYTDPAYQRKGLFALLINRSTQEAFSRGVEFIYGTPNDQSLPGYEKKANYQVIDGMDVSSYSLPLNLKPLLQPRTGRLPGSILATLYDALFSIRQAFRKASSRKVGGAIEELKSMPEDWDAFWRRARAPFDFIMARDRDIMEWRYFQNPWTFRFYVLKQGQEITACIVCRFVLDPALSTLVIADYLALPGRKDDLKPLLVRVIEDGLQADVAKVSAWCVRGGPYAPVFQSMGFLERSRIPVISYRNDLTRLISETCKTWHFTVGDSDNV
jgi:hypothetical protein